VKVRQGQKIDKPLGGKLPLATRKKLKRSEGQAHLIERNEKKAKNTLLQSHDTCSMATTNRVLETKKGKA